MSRPLEGVRVLDLSRLLPGPFAAMVLADLGAQVDKLEDPRAGDYARVSPPIIDGEGALFQHLNRGKRAITLDLKHPQGPSALQRLIPHYDVLIEKLSTRRDETPRRGLRDLTREKPWPNLQRSPAMDKPANSPQGRDMTQATWRGPGFLP